MRGDGVLYTGEAVAAALDVPRGVTALVGGGGKTTLQNALAAVLSKTGRVIVTTTTHIWPPAGMPLLTDPTEADVRAALENAPCVAVGQRAPDGKLTACAIPMETLLTMADYVLVEADGAKGLPLKAPAAHEPVIPACSGLVLAVAGLDGIGQTVAQTAFRPERYAQLLGTDTAHTVTYEDAARVLTHADGQRKGVPAVTRFCIVLNKADDARRVAWGKAMQTLPCMLAAERVLLIRMKEGTQVC